MRLIVAIALLTAASVVAIARSTDKDADVHGSLDETVDSILVTKQPPENAAAALDILATFSNQTTDSCELTIDEVKGKLLVIDESALECFSPGSLGPYAEEGIPIIGLNVEYADLVALTGFDMLLEKRGLPYDSLPPRAAKHDAGYFSYVWISPFDTDTAVSHGDSGRGELASSGLTSIKFEQLGLAAKGLIRNQRAGGRIEPIDSLATPAPGLVETAIASYRESSCCTFQIDLSAEEGIQDRVQVGAPESRIVELVLSGPSADLAALQFRLVYDDTALRPAPGAGGADGNPDLNEAGLGTGWNCSLPAGSGAPDIDSATGPGHGVALLVCYKTDAYVAPPDPVTIATFTFNVIAPGTHTIEISEAAIAGPAAAPVGSCNPVLDIEMTCIGGEIVASWD